MMRKNKISLLGVVIIITLIFSISLFGGCIRKEGVGENKKKTEDKTSNVSLEDQNVPLSEDIKNIEMEDEEANISEIDESEVDINLFS